MCDETWCLHIDRRIKATHVIGIGNVNDTELECIRDSNSSFFLFPTFRQFLEILRDLIRLLSQENGDDGDDFACIAKPYNTTTQSFVRNNEKCSVDNNILCYNFATT